MFNLAYINIFFSCQNAMTFYLPGAKRNNLATSSDVFNSQVALERAVQTQAENLQHYTAYFKFCEIVLCAICVVSSVVFQLWSIIEGDIVGNFTSEFRNKILTPLNTFGVESGDKNTDDPRKQYLEYFIKFFNEFKHFTSYGMKYMFIYIVAFSAHLCYILFFSWLLFEDIKDILSPSAYMNLIKLSLQDDFKQQRTDRLAVLFPELFSCLVSYTGISGTLVEATVTCTSVTNTWSSKIHVISLIFSWVMVCALFLDAMWLVICINTLPTAKSNGNPKLRKFLQAFGFGKRILFLLFAKNIDSLFWDEMLLSLFDCPKEVSYEPKKPKFYHKFLVQRHKQTPERSTVIEDNEGYITLTV